MRLPARGTPLLLVRQIQQLKKDRYQGAVAMTAEDLAADGKALAAGELFESADSLAQMLDFYEGALYGVGAPYGLGLLDFGNGYWGHAGQTLGFQSLWYTNPEEQITVVGLTNSASYSADALLNVINILDGKGAMSLGPLTLLPIGDDELGFLGDQVATKWEWVQVADPSGATDIAPGTTLVLFKDGSVWVQNEGCSVAVGTFDVDPSWQITFDLGPSDLTCDSNETTAQLLDLFDSADAWRFENGRLSITLDDVSSLLFDLAKLE